MAINSPTVLAAVVLWVVLADHATAQPFQNGPQMGFLPNSGFSGSPHRGFFPHPRFFHHSRFFPHRGSFPNHAFIGHHLFGRSTGVPVVILPSEPFIDTTPVQQLPLIANETATDPEIIVLPGQEPERLAPQTAPDYSYVSGCRAISNGYHCDFPSR
jgi:hypothetical protein